MDWVEACHILGVPESATESEIKEQYLYKAQLLHPDKNQDKPENIRKKAEAELVLVNQAYSILNNPVNNPYRVPPKLVVEPVGIRFTDVEIGEKKSTVLTIRNSGGPYTSIWLDNQPAPWLTVTGVKSISSERLPLEVALECTGFGEPGQQYFCNLAIKLENENTHVVDQAMVKIELLTRSEPVRPGNKTMTAASAKVPHPKPSWYAPVTQSVSKKQSGFSLKAFIANLFAFALLAVIAAYFIRTYLPVSDFIFLIGSALYAVIAIGLSFHQGLTIGSKPERLLSIKRRR